jgi:hypothetical protein
MLAGDVFSNRAVRRRLLLFKGMYALVSLLLRLGIVDESAGPRSRPRPRRTGRVASE